MDEIHSWYGEGFNLLPNAKGSKPLIRYRGIQNTRPPLEVFQQQFDHAGNQLGYDPLVGVISSPISILLTFDSEFREHREILNQILPETRKHESKSRGTHYLYKTDAPFASIPLDSKNGERVVDVIGYTKQVIVHGPGYSPLNDEPISFLPKSQFPPLLEKIVQEFDLIRPRVQNPHRGNLKERLGLYKPTWNDRFGILSAFKTEGLIQDFYEGNGQVSLHCPYHQKHKNHDAHPSASIFETDEGELFFHCFVCGYFDVYEPLYMAHPGKLKFKNAENWILTTLGKTPVPKSYEVPPEFFKALKRKGTKLPQLLNLVHESNIDGYFSMPLEKVAKALEISKPGALYLLKKLESWHVLGLNNPAKQHKAPTYKIRNFKLFNPEEQEFTRTKKKLLNSKLLNPELSTIDNAERGLVRKTRDKYNLSNNKTGTAGLSKITQGKVELLNSGNKGGDIVQCTPSISEKDFWALPLPERVNLVLDSRKGIIDISDVEGIEVCHRALDKLEGVL